MDLELGVPEFLLAAVTAIATVLTSIGIQSKWSSKTKNLVAFIVSLVLALGYLLMQGKLNDWSDIPGTVLGIYGLQQLIYKLFQEKFRQLEAVTSVKPGEKIIVEEGEPNKVLETGNQNAEVEIIADENHPEHEQPVAVAPATPENHPPRADRILG